MKDHLATIKRIIEWHQTIRGHVKLVGDAISDQEALICMETARTDWIPGRLEAVSEKRNRLQQTLGFLSEGLANHFAFEEKVLPPLLGELFMRALILDHNEIRKEIDQAKSIIAHKRLEGLKRDKLLAEEADIQQAVDSMGQLVEEHTAREETLLEMLKRALQQE